MKLDWSKLNIPCLLFLQTGGLFIGFNVLVRRVINCLMVFFAVSTLFTFHLARHLAGTITQLLQAASIRVAVVLEEWLLLFLLCIILLLLDRITSPDKLSMSSKLGDGAPQAYILGGRLYRLPYIWHFIFTLFGQAINVTAVYGLQLVSLHRVLELAPEGGLLHLLGLKHVLSLS